MFLPSGLHSPIGTDAKWLGEFQTGCRFQKRCRLACLVIKRHHMMGQRFVAAPVILMLGGVAQQISVELADVVLVEGKELPRVENSAYPATFGMRKWTRFEAGWR